MKCEDGKLPTAWTIKPLGTMCEVVRGGSPRPIMNYLTTSPTGVNWLKIGDVGETDKYFTRAAERIKLEGTTKSRKVERGDLLLSNSMSFGRAFITLIDGYIHDGWLRLRSDERVLDKEYLYYFLLSPFAQNQFKSVATGSVVANLKSETVKALEVLLPPLPEQKRIAAILSSLDDKIELNNKLNANLEQQAQALYRFYFPYDVTSELPNGWRVGTVGEIACFHDFKRIPLSGSERGKMKEKRYPYYGAASLMDYVDDYIFDGRYLLLGEDGTVVNSVGLPVLQYVWGKFWVNNHAHVLTGELGFSVESLYMLFKQTSVQSIVTGAVQPKISQAGLRSVEVVIPPESLLSSFNIHVDPLFKLIRDNVSENICLAKIRDFLLPKLMSGEIQEA